MCFSSIRYLSTLEPVETYDIAIPRVRTLTQAGVMSNGRTR